MASFGIPDENSDRAMDAAPPPDDAGIAESVDVPARDERSTRRFSSSRVMGPAERERALAEARDTDFPVSLRGYERAAVDRYVERVTRLITELEMSSSPEAAVRHALDEVSEETRDILQRAYQTADEIAARSRSKADDRIQQAEQQAQEMLEGSRREADEMLEGSRREADETLATSRREAQELRDTTAAEVQSQRESSQRETGDLRERTTRELAELREEAAREAHQLRAAAQRESDETRGTARREAETMVETAETRARDLARNAEAIWRERQRLMDDMRAVGEQLMAIGEVEGKRFVRPVEDSFLRPSQPNGHGSPGVTESAEAPQPASTDPAAEAQPVSAPTQA